MSLRSGAQVQEALRRLGHEVVAIDAGPGARRAAAATARPDAAFVALHGARRRGRDRAGAAGGSRRPVHGLGTGGLHALHRQGAGEVPDARGGHPHAGVPRAARGSIKELGAGAALGAIERTLGFPLVVKPARARLGAGRQVRRTQRASCPAAMVGALLLRPQGPDRALRQGPRPGGLGARRRDGERGAPIALPVVEAIPREEDFYNYESRYEIGMTTFVCPAELDAETTASARSSWRSRRLRAARLPRRRAGRPDARAARAASCRCSRRNVVPGLTETSLLPQAADAAGIGFDELVERILASAFTR